MKSPDNSLPLLDQVRIATQIGELSDEQVMLFRQMAGLSEKRTLPEDYFTGAPLWAWHGPLLIGYGRIVYSATKPLWIDEVAVIPEYRDEGIEREIVYRLATVCGTTSSASTLLLFGIAKVATTISMIVHDNDAERHL